LTFTSRMPRVMTAANYAEAHHAKRMDRAFTVSLLIFSFSITVAPQVLGGRIGWLNSLVTILGALTVSLAAIQYALDLGAKSSAHKAAAAEFSRIRRELELLAIGQPEAGQALRAHLDLHLRELSTCASLAPLVSEVLVRKYFGIYLTENKKETAQIMPIDSRLSHQTQQREKEQNVV